MAGNTQPLGQQSASFASPTKDSGPEMQTVQSSHVNSIGYDAAKQELYVTWNSGKTSIYSSVPASVHQSVIQAPSVGKAIHLNVKKHYQHRYADTTFTPKATGALDLGSIG